MHLQFQFALSEDDRSRIRMMVLFSNLIFLFNNVAFFFFLLNSSWFVDSHPYRLSCVIVITNFRFTHFGSFCLAF